MNNTQTLNWQAFKETLKQNPGLSLQFQYAENRRVDQSYHITEIKSAPITSVDCGGKMNSWTEIIIQLWEPSEKQTERAMNAAKALSIIELVERSLPLNPLAVVKVEFGNSAFDTRQMFPGSIRVENDSLIVDLRPDQVQCKAIGRGDSCGTPNTGETDEASAASENCCSTPAAEKPTIRLQTLAAAEVCTPGSGCC